MLNKVLDHSLYWYNVEIRKRRKEECAVSKGNGCRHDNKYSDLFELKGTFSLICLNGKTWRRRQRLYCRLLKVEDLSSSLTTSYSQRQFFSASLSFLLIDDRIRHRQRLYFWSFFDLRGRCLNHLSSIPSSSNFQSFDRIGSAEGEERVEQEHSPHVQLKKKNEEESRRRGIFSGAL